MAQSGLDRRGVLALAGAGLGVAGAGLFAARAAGAAIIQQLTASRLTPLSDQIYEPPVTLQAVADIYRRMTAAVIIDGKGPYPFVVDTGANQSVIAAELAQSLGLILGPTEPLNGIAGIDMAPTTTATLRLDKRMTSQARLSVLPSKAIGGDGILGLDRLDGQELTLNFRDETLAIAPPGKLWDDPALITMRAHRRDGQLTLVDADLAGIPITAFLDSGAQNTIGNRVLRRLAITREPTVQWSQTAILSATGQTIMGEMAELPALRLGGVKLPNWPVAFADLHTFRMWDLTRTPAILVGVDILSRFQSVCLDFARNEVRFLPPPASE